MSPDKTPSLDIDGVAGVVRLRLSRESILEIEIGVVAADVQVQVPVPKPKAKLLSWSRQDFEKDRIIDIRVSRVDVP